MRRDRFAKGLKQPTAKAASARSLAPEDDPAAEKFNPQRAFWQWRLTPGTIGAPLPRLSEQAKRLLAALELRAHIREGKDAPRAEIRSCSPDATRGESMTHRDQPG